MGWIIVEFIVLWGIVLSILPFHYQKQNWCGLGLGLKPGFLGGSKDDLFLFFSCILDRTHTMPRKAATECVDGNTKQEQEEHECGDEEEKLDTEVVGSETKPKHSPNKRKRKSKEKEAAQKEMPTTKRRAVVSTVKPPLLRAVCRKAPPLLQRPSPAGPSLRWGQDHKRLLQLKQKQHTTVDL